MMILKDVVPEMARNLWSHTSHQFLSNLVYHSMYAPTFKKKKKNPRYNSGKKI